MQIAANFFNMTHVNTSRSPLQWPLYIWILISMVLGIAWGLLVSSENLTNFQNTYIAPWGQLFLRLLKFIAVPLVFVSVICGILSMVSLRKLLPLAVKTLTLYIITTIAAIVIGLLLVNAIKPGEGVNKENFVTQSEIQAPPNQAEKDAAPFFPNGLFPENLFASMSDNSAMLQIITAALMIGISLLLIPAEKRRTLTAFFEEANLLFITMIRWVMLLALPGVFALISTVIAGFGGQSGLFIGLGMYILTVLMGLFFLLIFVYPMLLWLIKGISPRYFLRAIFPAQLVAFSTSSSSATLPVTTIQVREKLGVSDEVSGFVLPLGATVNMDGTSLYQAVAAVFIAQVYQMNLDFADQMMILLTALLGSIGSPGIPGGSIVMMIMVLSSVGIPAEGLALILGVDRILDMFRTTVNVTGDAFVCCLLHKKVDIQKI